MARLCASLALAGGFALLAESTQTAIANGDTRTLSFYHTHSHEKITVTFKKNGRYDPAALKQLNHFMRDWRNQKQIAMEPRLFDVVWEVQKDAGSKAPVQIISSYRSPETNEGLRSRSKGVAKNSQHTLGRALDIHLPDVNMAKIREAGLRLQRGGVGFYPTSAKPFVHLDVGNVRHWPRMSRDQLVRLFPDGRTVHIPSDGKPLKNYQLALADVANNGATVRGMSQTQVATAVRNRKNGNGSSPGFIAKFFGADAEEDDAPSAPVAAPAPAEIAAPVAVAAIDRAIPMPAPRPHEVAGPQLAAAGPELASAYAPQQLPAAPGMIWNTGPDAVAGRAATSTETPGSFAMPLPRPADTTPAALVASAAPGQIQPGANPPVTASLAPPANAGDARLEAMRLLGLLNNDPKPAPAPVAAAPSRVSSAHDVFTHRQRRESRPEAPATIPEAAPQAAPAVTLAVSTVAPKSAYSPQRSARNRAQTLNHPHAAAGMIAKPAGVLPASFGGNPSMGMRSDLFGGSPVAGLRSLNVGPERTAQLGLRR